MECATEWHVSRNPLITFSFFVKFLQKQKRQQQQQQQIENYINAQYSLITLSHSCTIYLRSV